MDDAQSARLTAPRGGATVRMYDPGGLGDCFLLAFDGPPASEADDGTRYVLIDCGVFNGTDGGADRMRAIARDVVAATGGQLHVLVVTHEHWDHLSGFQAAYRTFEDDLQIDEVWAAWTEDPSDPDAVRLQRELDADFGMLTAAAERLRRSEERALRERADEIEGILGFLGLGGTLDAFRDVPDRFGARRSLGTARLMDVALTLGDRVRYLSPGEAPLAVGGARAFVLGPPRDEQFLRRSNPRTGEVYEHATAPPPSTPEGLASAVRRGNGPDTAAPFADHHGVDLATIGGAGTGEPVAAFYHGRYGTGEGTEAAPAWRRIEEDWLGVAESLALQLDDDVNNTSLVLAFELADGRVLLFPGDAQVGNWLSWHDLAWDDGGRTVTAEGLLGRTVLYKVGHHASHNATLRGRGLELMSHPDLVALVPVNAKQAAKKKWAMPFEPLATRLEQKCGGRVLRADTKVPARPPGVSERLWKPFQSRVQVAQDGLWVEVAVC